MGGPRPHPICQFCNPKRPRGAWFLPTSLPGIISCPRCSLSGRLSLQSSDLCLPPGLPRSGVPFSALGISLHPLTPTPNPGVVPGSFLPLPNPSVRPLSPEASQIRQPPAATRVQAVPSSCLRDCTAGASDLIPPPPLLLPNVSLPACTLECLWHSSLSTQSETRASCEACAALRDLPARPASVASAPEPLSCLLPSATSAAVLICSQAHACAGLCTCSSLCLGHSPEMPSWLTASLHSSRCSSVGSSGRPSRPP